MGAAVGAGFGIACSLLLEGSCVLGLPAAPGVLLANYVAGGGLPLSTLPVYGFLNTVGYAVIGFLGWCVYRWFYGPTHYAPFCTRCGYDLTGNTSGRCPECGTALSFERDRGRTDERSDP